METLQTIFQAEVFQILGWTLVHFVWQAAAIGLTLAIVLRMLHKSTANLRYIIACAALVLVVLMPAVTIRMIGVPIKAVDQVKLQALFPEVVANTEAVIEIPQPATLPLPVAAIPNPPLTDRLIERVNSSLPFIVTGWLIGVFGLSLWHLGGWTQLQRLRKRMVKHVTPPLKAKLQQLSNALGIQKTVGLMESALVQIPTVVGHLKPVILLP
ncbi:MAG: hypothetical protein FVQ79_12220, partial [Planctomycetes bacterium]|nr:hypothetical protein [Planctomycetota bacterium]